MQPVTSHTINNPAIANRPAAQQKFYGGADVFEYLLTVQPDPVTQNLLMAEKEAFSREHPFDGAIGKTSSIKLASFWANEAMEDTITRWMQRICSKQQSFRVTLNNYSGFPPHNIFLRVQNPFPFQQLAIQLKVIDNYIRSYGLPDARINEHPHLTLASRIPEELYRQAMLNFAQRDFHQSFIVNELVMMRRKSKADGCKKINVFGLMPELDDTNYPLAPMQKSLFNQWQSGATQR